MQFNRQYGTTRYVNSAWAQQSDPYGGDVINAYNDGPTAPGKPSLGGFYEIETSSPARRSRRARRRSTCTGRRTTSPAPKPALDPIARKLLGVSLDETDPHEAPGVAERGAQRCDAPREHPRAVTPRRDRRVR